MKNIDGSAISNTNGLPVKSGTLLFLQQAYQEIVYAAIQSIIGNRYNQTSVYNLFNNLDTGSGQVHSISGGAVYYNGVVYLTNPASFTSPAGQVAVGNIVTTNYLDSTADPVIFTDGVARNVHKINTINWTSGVAGSGLVDFTNLKKGNSAQIPVGGIIDYAPATLAEFDNSGLGIAYNTIGWAICNGNNGTVSLGGRFTVGYSKLDAVFGNLGNTGGERDHALTINEMPSHSHPITIASGGASGGFAAGAGTPQKGTTDAIGLGAYHNNLPPYYTTLKIQRLY